MPACAPDWNDCESVLTHASNGISLDTDGHGNRGPGGSEVKFFVVTYVHPDTEGREKHLSAHVDFLDKLLEVGTLRASGLSPARLRSRRC